MKTRLPSSRLTLLASVGLTTLLGAVAAQAQTVISSLPATITTGGLYVLNSNLSSTQTSGNLITVNASNVTIDMQNHYITCSGGAGQSTVGISATEHGNLTVQNGTISYCYTGIFTSGNNTATTNNVGDRFLNLRVAHCYSYGLDIEFAPSCNVISCQVSSIGGSTYSPNDSVGINVDGSGVTVQGCSVSNVATPSGGSGYCIYSDGGSFTRQCQLSNATYGISLGIFEDNLASNCTTAFSGGTNGGGNTSDGGTATDVVQSSKYHQ